MHYDYDNDVCYVSQEFGGNSDKSIERYQFLNSPFVARYIRIYPVGWSNKISMRAGLLGCPYTGCFTFCPRNGLPTHRVVFQQHIA